MHCILKLHKIWNPGVKTGETVILVTHYNWCICIRMARLISSTNICYLVIKDYLETLTSFEILEKNRGKEYFVIKKKIKVIYQWHINT